MRNVQTAVFLLTVVGLGTSGRAIAPDPRGAQVQSSTEEIRGSSSDDGSAHARAQRRVRIKVALLTQGFAGSAIGRLAPLAGDDGALYASAKRSHHRGGSVGIHGMRLQRHLISWLAILPIVCTAEALWSQAPSPGDSMLARGDSLLAHGDTIAAITAYEAAEKIDGVKAEAKYRAGSLYFLRFLNDGRRDSLRHIAEDDFSAAVAMQRDSAKYWLGLSEALRSESAVRSRIRAAECIDTAVAMARRYGGAAVADVEYRAGVFEWERYEQQAHRYVLNSAVMSVDADKLATDWRYAEDFFRRQVRPGPDDAGLRYREAAEDHLRDALAADPRHVTAAGLLVVLLGDEGRWEEAYDAARTLTRAAPDSGRALALLGLAMTRLHRWREAQATFVRALTRMSAQQRGPYENLTLILRAADSTRFAAAPTAELVGIDSVYWLAGQPLYLNDVNETKVEFYARLTLVIHRWSDPLRGYQGYESDRGAVYVRYGPPDIWATLGTGAINNAWYTSERALSDQGDPIMAQVMHNDAAGMLEDAATSIAWVYREAHLAFVFAVAPGYARGIFVSNNRAVYREARNNAPVRFDNVPDVRNMDSVDLQVAQFRSDSSKRTDVAVFSFVPVQRMTQSAAHLAMNMETAAIVKDQRMQDVVRNRRDVQVQSGDSTPIQRYTWRLALAPQSCLLRVEARLPALDRGARGATPLEVRSFKGDSLMLSDVVLARNIVPRDSAPKTWTDFLVDPSAGRFLPSQPMSLLWETYNLTPDSSGVARYRVEIRISVHDVIRHDFAASIIGAIGDAVGVSARGDTVVSLSYDEHRPALAHGREVEYVNVSFQNPRTANYDVTIRVTDLLTGHVAASPPRRFVTEADAGRN